MKPCKETRYENLTLVFKGTTKEMSDEDVEYYVNHPELKDDFCVICYRCLAIKRGLEK